MASTLNTTRTCGFIAARWKMDRKFSRRDIMSREILDKQTNRILAEGQGDQILRFEHWRKGI